MNAKYVKKLIEGVWSLTEESWGWEEIWLVKKIIPVYVWPDGGQILSIDRFSAYPNLAFVSPSRVIPPEEVLFDVSGQSFVRTSIHRIPPSASHLLTFLRECGSVFHEEFGIVIKEKRSYLPVSESEQEMFRVPWVWVEGGEFVGTDKEQVGLDVLLGNVPLPLQRFQELERRIREANGWPEAN